MRKLIVVLFALLLLAGAGCSRGGKEKKIELDMFISQPEYAEAIRALLAEYKKEVPQVTVNYETVQSDYAALLKGRLNSGSVPDIFASTAGAEIDEYREYSLNLDGLPAANAMVPAVADGFKSVADGSGPYAFAIKSNFFGLIYNQEIFEKAGIAAFPKTLDELETACQKIAALGIKPFTSGFAEWWVYKHTAMNFLGTASSDSIALIKKFEQGEARFSDYPRLYNDLFRYIDLVKKYGDDKLLETTLDREIAAFANGQAAIVNGQGPWIETDVLKINPSLRIGFAGYPVSNNSAECKVVTGAEQAMRVSNSSKHEKELLDFVNWWYTSDYGKSWFADVAKVVPPISAGAIPDMQIPRQGAALVAQDGSAPLTIIYSTDAFHSAFGEAMQAYIGGTASKDQTCALIERQWKVIH